MILFRPKIPKAGSVRIGEPPDPKTGKRSVSKINHFQFCVPTKGPGEKHYAQDQAMHDVYGEKPTSFGPVYFISDNVFDAMRISLEYWASSRAGISKRMCFFVFNSLGDLDEQKNTASRLKEDGYVEYPCLSSECPDFVAKKCNKSVFYRFLDPKGSTLGEYFMSARSYPAINAALGFIKMLERILPVNYETGELIGLSKIPIYFDLQMVNMQFKDPKSGRLIPTQVYYPVPVIREKGGAYESIVRIAEQEKRAQLRLGEKLGAKAQKMLAQESIVEAVHDEDELVLVEEEESATTSVPPKKAPAPKAPVVKKEEKQVPPPTEEKAEEVYLDEEDSSEVEGYSAEEEGIEDHSAAEELVSVQEEATPPIVEGLPQKKMPAEASQEPAPLKEKEKEKTLATGGWVMVRSLSTTSPQSVSTEEVEMPEGADWTKRMEAFINTKDNSMIVLPAGDAAKQVLDLFRQSRWTFSKLRQFLSVNSIESAINRLSNTVRL